MSFRNNLVNSLMTSNNQVSIKIHKCLKLFFYLNYHLKFISINLLNKFNIIVKVDINFIFT